MGESVVIGKATSTRGKDGENVDSKIKKDVESENMSPGMVYAFEKIKPSKQYAKIKSRMFEFGKMKKRGKKR